MNKNWVIIGLGGALLGCLLILWHRSNAPGAAPIAATAAHSAELTKTALVEPMSLAEAPAKGRNYTETHVSMARVKEDHDYALRVGKHQIIKAYLASPLKGKAEFEPVLDWMIKNGYGIEDLQIIWPQAQGIAQHLLSRDEIEARLRKVSGPDRSEAEIVAAAQRLWQRQEPLAKEELRFEVGLHYDETEALESLWRYAKQVPNSLDRWGPFAEAEEGEPLLTDDDWMSPYRKQLKADYTGPERHSILSQVNSDGFRPPPSPDLTPEEMETLRMHMMAKYQGSKAGQ
jgi:hypothetical protein